MYVPVKNIQMQESFVPRDKADLAYGQQIKPGMKGENGWRKN